jgi:hypothetical protein
MRKLLGLIFPILLALCVFVPASASASTGSPSQSTSNGLLTEILSFLNLTSQNQTSAQYKQMTQYPSNNTQSYQNNNQSNSNSDCWSWLIDLWNCCCGGGGGQGGHGGGDDGGCGKDCFSNDHGQCSSADVWKQWYSY